MARHRMAQQNLPGSDQPATSFNGEEHFRFLSDLTSAFAYLRRLEADGRLVPEWVGGAATRVTGYSPDEIMPPGLEQLIFPDDRPVFRRHIERALETIDRNAKLQARLIEDMLDLSRITPGKLRLD